LQRVRSPRPPGDQPARLDQPASREALIAEYAGSMSDVEFPDLREEPAREAVVSIVERVAA
jgi:hypothetical protein